MNTKNNIVSFYGKCIKALPGAKFYVKLNYISNSRFSYLSNVNVIGKVCGKMMNRKIRLNVNDSVEIEFPYYEIMISGKQSSFTTKQLLVGRIVKRLPSNL